METGYDNALMEITKIVFGAIIGIVCTIIYNRYNDRRAERKELFIKMIVAKGSLRISQELIEAMNLIPILFKGNKKIIGIYNNYFASLCLPIEQVVYEEQVGLYWDLLREIGGEVGYSGLDNKTFSHRYVPTQSLAEQESQEEFHSELLHYLKQSNSLLEVYLKQVSQEVIVEEYVKQVTK